MEKRRALRQCRLALRPSISTHSRRPQAAYSGTDLHSSSRAVYPTSQTPPPPQQQQPDTVPSHYSPQISPSLSPPKAAMQPINQAQASKQATRALTPPIQLHPLTPPFPPLLLTLAPKLPERIPPPYILLFLPSITMLIGQMARIQTRNHAVAVGERLTRYGDADGGGAGGDEPGAGGGVGWEGGVGWVSGGGGGSGCGGHC